ncbi:MAG TPA: FixH family protein, partial [Pseudomonadota bacterium]|nr:FixH family protein [Pseudomonadota bacterium]
MSSIMSADNFTSDTRRNPRELTGRTVLICLVLFFALVAGVNAVMIKAAVTTFGGVESENSYQAGLAFAQQIAAARSQD